MKDGELLKKLRMLISMFDGRPHHLSEYLIENSALTQNFKKKLLTLKDDLKSQEHFKNISEMRSYYDYSIFDNEKKTRTGIEKELNLKLNNLISEERYEEAAGLRDYMRSKGYKKY